MSSAFALWLSVLMAFAAFTALSSAPGAAARSSGADQVPVVELELTQGQVNANLARAVAAIQAQVAVLQSALSSVASNALVVKRLQAPTNVSALPPATDCANLTCVRDAINAMDSFIMQLYAKRLSFARQAGEIKEAVVVANAAANAVANGLPDYAGSVMFGNYCMLYVSKRLQVEYLNAEYNANLTLPIQHADNFTSSSSTSS